MTETTDFTAVKNLFYKNHILFNLTKLFDENNEPCGFAFWLDKGGHIEFDIFGKITNIVCY